MFIFNRTLVNKCESEWIFFAKNLYEVDIFYMFFFTLWGVRDFKGKSLVEEPSLVR